MESRLRVGVLAGGKSVEHEISCLSAQNILRALDRKKYAVTLVGIDKQGRWFLQDEELFYQKGVEEGEEVLVKMGGLMSLAQRGAFYPLDVVFPVLHGTGGEDGSIQGLLQLMEVPWVGAGVVGSAIGMDKDVMKRLLKEAGIPIARFRVARWGEEIDLEGVGSELGYPLFVKPASLGSSVGVRKVASLAELLPALEHAWEYDHKVLIEEGILGSELECSVLGNEKARVSLPGELIPRHEFYSYEAKYLDAQGADFTIPAEIPEEKIAELQRLALKTYEVLCCEGMARIDFFYTRDGELLVNEINTIPGFTSISMYPKLWEIAGISCSDLVDELIQLALERREKEKRLKRSFR